MTDKSSPPPPPPAAADAKLTRYVVLQQVIHLAGTDLGKVLDVDLANSIQAEENGLWVPDRGLRGPHAL